ncbi:hypothetical protein H671_1g2523 [Cricetulus griseus]|nr:hypothetical protein H671_1g2523 [Cricetulus griseus]
MGPDGGCTVPMLSRPSWEERRKGGEGRGRPRQAKNAIIVVVGAGRPLCLDGKGSGDTQDEPRDCWHVLTDRDQNQPQWVKVQAESAQDLSNV